MLIIFMGQSCSGKNAAANEFRKHCNVTMIKGRDYLSLDPDETTAKKKFIEMMTEAQSNPMLDGSLVYITNSSATPAKLERFEKAVRIRFSADIETIRNRHRERLAGFIPRAIDATIDSQFAVWNSIPADYVVDTSGEHDVEHSAGEVYDYLKSLEPHL